MDSIERKHLLIDLKTGPSEIKRRLEAQGIKISVVYVSDILDGGRTGFGYRGPIMKVLLRIAKEQGVDSSRLADLFDDTPRNKPGIPKGRSHKNGTESETHK